MSCCFGKDTDGNEPQKSISDQSNPPSNRPIIPVNKPGNHKIEYSITVKTGDFRNSATNGPVYINIFGRDEKQSGELLLPASNKPFAQGSARKFQINAIDIGKPQRILLRHDDKSTGWYVDYVEISVHNFLIRFVANRWLNQSKNDQKLYAELFASEQPAVVYNIEVLTGAEQIEALDSPVYIQIHGTTTTTPKVYLESKTASFTKNFTSKFSISTNNVGEIQRILIGHEGLGKVNDWYLKHLQIQMLDQQQEYEVGQWLSPTLGDRRLFVELSKENPPPPPVSPAYLISIQTADVRQNERTENVEMIVRGSNGQISRVSLKDYTKSTSDQLFRKGNLDQFQIDHPNIGTIESITIGFSDSKQKIAWFLEHVDIKYGETINHFRAQCWLSNRLGPNFSWTTLKPAANDDDINYRIRVETGQAGVEANVILCIFGDEETTTNLALRTTKDGTEAKFEKDSVLEFDLPAVDVGKIKKINIGHDGKGSEQEWFLKTVQIEKKDEQFIFNANRWLSEEKDDQKTFIDLLPEEQKTPSPSPVLEKDQATYVITIVTSSDEHAGTDSGVLMSIFGDKNATKQFQVITTKQGDQAVFEIGTTNEFQMELDDVGHINQINIGQDGKGSHPKWHLESVQIQKGSGNYYFLAEKTLDQSTPFVDLTPTPRKKTPSPEPVQIREPSPEPVQAKAPTPEPAQAKTPTPEPVKIREPSPEPVQAKAPTPEPPKAKTPTPEPPKAKTPTPEPPKAKTPTTEPAKAKTPTPEPPKAKTPTPEPAKAKTPTPEPAKTKTPTPEPVKAKTPTPEPSKAKAKTPEQKSPPVEEATYKILIQADPYQKDDSNIYLTIHGQNNQTDKLYLKNSLASNKKNELEFKTTNVGKISKVVLGRENSENDASWHVDNITIKRNHETTTFNVEQALRPNSKIELVPSAIPKKTEATYKILLQTGASQEEGDKSNLTITIFGQNGQTKRMPLDQSTKTNKKTPFKKEEKIEFDFKTHDVGKISKITLHQNPSEQGVLWHIQSLTIKRNNDATTFNVDRQLEENLDLELTPSPILKKSETPRKAMKTSETISKLVIKTKDADYEINITTGDQACEGSVVLKIRGENGIVTIPLTKSTTNEKPFQSKSTDQFTCRTNDVGKIKRITLEHQGTDEKFLWHIKTVQIKKRNETYDFIANVRLDHKENKANLYPVGAFLGHQKEDYVQSELRRLRESLRSESAKLHPPQHKAHEPFVFNDLSPYFDTSPVERAIYSPNDAPAGYYTRVTALRVVEPWEAYGMDYGVSYELLKQRKSRSSSSKRPVSKSGDESVDRKQGSTHLPKFPCVDMHKPAEYSRPLTMDDVPRIRTLIRNRYTTQADTQMEKDYKRTHDDFYRMQLDNLDSYHESNRKNMLQIYHSYLENTPGSKKAVRELCDRVALNTSKSSVETSS